MQRRAFFQLIAGAMIAPVVAQSEGLTGEIFTGPVLWGDGEHDDTEALQALIDGHVVEFADPTMAEGAGWYRGRVFYMPHGTFLISGPLVFRDLSDVILGGFGAVLLRSQTEPNQPWMRLINCSNVAICLWTVEYLNPASALRLES